MTQILKMMTQTYIGNDPDDCEDDQDDNSEDGSKDDDEDDPDDSENGKKKIGNKLIGCYGSIGVQVERSQKLQKGGWLITSSYSQYSEL